MYTIDINNNTRSVCTFARPLESPRLSFLKIKDTVTFLSGFNVWPNVTALTPLAYGDANIRRI